MFVVGLRGADAPRGLNSSKVASYATCFHNFPDTISWAVLLLIPNFLLAAYDPYIGGIGGAPGGPPAGGAGGAPGGFINPRFGGAPAIIREPGVPPPA